MSHLLSLSLNLNCVALQRMTIPHKKNWPKHFHDRKQDTGRIIAFFLFCILLKYMFTHASLVAFQFQGKL